MTNTFLLLLSALLFFQMVHSRVLLQSSQSFSSNNGITDCHGYRCPEGTRTCTKKEYATSETQKKVTTITCSAYNGQVLSVHKKEEPFNTGRKGKGYSMRMTSSFKSSRIISD